MIFARVKSGETGVSFSSRDDGGERRCWRISLDVRESLRSRLQAGGWEARTGASLSSRASLERGEDLFGRGEARVVCKRSSLLDRRNLTHSSRRQRDRLPHLQPEETRNGEVRRAFHAEARGKLNMQETGRRRSRHVHDPWKRRGRTKYQWS